MEKLNETQLSQIVLELIRLNFDTPDKVAQVFKRNLKLKLKRISPRQLTDREIDAKTLVFATSVFNNLGLITSENIIPKLSEEIILKSRESGITPGEYDRYFLDLAHKMVRQLLELQFQRGQQEVKKSTTKKRRK